MLHKLSRPQAFFFGAASILNLSGASQQPSYLRRTADEAIAGDFASVGSYLCHAMERQPVQTPDEAATAQLEFADFPA